MGAGVIDDELYMWRAIVAMAHADDVVTPEEVVFMKEMVKGSALSQEQLEILEGDLKNPKDAADMFFRINDPKLRSRFFRYARMLCWCDGDFGAQEQEIITILQRDQARNIDLSEFQGNKDIDLGLELEMDDSDRAQLAQTYDELHRSGRRGLFARLFGRG